MEHSYGVQEVGAEQIQHESTQRHALGHRIVQITSRQYDGVYGQMFAEYDLRRTREEQAAIPYNVPGQLMLSIETNE